MSRYVQNTLPAAIVEPVTLTELKAHLRLEHNDDVVYLKNLVKKSREAAENYIEGIISDRSFTLNLDNFESVIEIERNPVDDDSITIAYKDDLGAPQTVANFLVESNRYSTTIRPNYEEAWPTITPGKNKVQVTFDAGYEAAFQEVPYDIKCAIERIAATLLNNAEDHVIGTIIAKVPLSAEYLLEPYVVKAHT